MCDILLLQQTNSKLNIRFTNNILASFKVELIWMCVCGAGEGCRVGGGEANIPSFWIPFK